MDKKRLPAIRKQAEEVVEAMQTDISAQGNPTGIRLLAEALIALIDALGKDD